MKNPWSWFAMALMGLAFFVLKLNLHTENMPKVRVTLYHPYECRLLDPKPKFDEPMEFSMTHVNFGENDFYFLCKDRQIYRVTERVSRENVSFETVPYYDGVPVDSVPKDELN